jgi:hypothetical protein
MNPECILNQGIQILDPFLNVNGFKFQAFESGKGSGGNFASGKYVKNNKIIELSYRYGLGKVRYCLDELNLYHDDYMKLLGVYGKNHYPGFSETPSQAFTDLLYDLENFCGDFIIGEGKDFIELAIKMENNPELFKGFKSISNIKMNT